MADRLAASRLRRFVGRGAELAWFAGALEPGSAAAVVVVHGPAGVGKSSLTRRFGELALERGHPVLALDARDLPTTAAAVELAFAPLLATDPPGRRPVALLDTYEVLAGLDGWLRDVLLPRLPADTLVVLAGRNPPAAGWRTDPGWADLVHALPLRNLSPADSRRYLEVIGVPAAKHQDCVDFTHGYPLALTLAGEVARSDQAAVPRDSPDLIRALLTRLLDGVPGDGRHRAALEACAVARALTEPVLASMLKTDDVAGLFEWLRGLPIVESGPGGVFPHDLARDVLVADLAWRDARRLQALNARARVHYLRELPAAAPAAQERLLLDLMYLHSGLRAFLLGADAGAGPAVDLRLGRLAGADAPAVRALVERHEGEQSAALAAHWLERAPQAWQVVRNAAGELVGALAILDLAALAEPDAQRDPAVRAARAELARRPPLREGERASHLRFWLTRDTYQGVGPVQNLIAARWAAHYLTTPNLAFTFTPFADPQFWAGFCAYADQLPVPVADFEVGGRHYGVFGHDWRAVSPTAWAQLLSDREITEPAVHHQQQGQQQPAPASDAALLVLSREEFEASVRAALRDLQRPDRLARNPLLRCRLVAARLGDHRAPVTADRVAALQAVLAEAAAGLEASPRDARGYRALHRTYLRPAGTHEKAAEVLGLPSSTFRRHLAAGTGRLTDLLWDRELS